MALDDVEDDPFFSFLEEDFLTETTRVGVRILSGDSLLTVWRKSDLTLSAEEDTKPPDLPVSPEGEDVADLENFGDEDDDDEDEEDFLSSSCRSMNLGLDMSFSSSFAVMSVDWYDSVRLVQNLRLSGTQYQNLQIIFSSSSSSHWTARRALLNCLPGSCVRRRSKEDWIVFIQWSFSTRVELTNVIETSGAMIWKGVTTCFFLEEGLAMACCSMCSISPGASSGVRSLMLTVSRGIT